MSISSTTALAYCAQDQSFAKKIEADLKSVASFRHFVASENNDDPSLSQQLQDFNGSILLLVSDNFLRSPNAMHHANRLLSQRGKRGSSTQAVLLSIERYDEQIGETVIIPAKIARQVDIMGYINHWQERYLDLRRQKSALSQEIGPAFDQYLVKIREVSGQVNDFLHYLKDSMPLHLVEFSADKYRQFFIFMDAEPLWNNFQLPVTPDTHTQTTNNVVADAATTVESSIIEDVISEENLQIDADSVIPSIVEEETANLEEAVVDNDVSIPTLTNETATSVVQETTDNTDIPEATTLQAVTTETSSSKSLSGSEIDKLIKRAWRLADNGDWQTGLDLLESGISAQPGQADLSYHKALMLGTEADRTTEARQIIDELLEEQADHQDALFLSGELYLANDDYEQAREHWELLADINSEYPDLGQELGLLLVEHYPKDQLLALKQLEKAVKEESEEVQVHYHYGRLIGAELNKPNKAIKALQKAVALAPNHALSHYELARQQYAAGQYQASQESYQLAYGLDASLRTAENDLAFTPSANQGTAKATTQIATTTTTNKAPKTTTKATLKMMTEQESGALSALKSNIAELEALIQEREAKAKAAEAQAAATLLEARPGNGKIVMISGATSGIGRATAEALAKSGYDLIITGRREERLKSISEALKEFNVSVLPLSFDVRDNEAVKAAIDGLSKKWSSIDILINNAGKAKGYDPIHKGDLEHWDEMIDVNLKGLLYLTRAVAPKMARRKKGTIINVCSTAGKEVYPNGNVYCATKHAVNALTQAMRLDLVKYGIKVGQISPAHVEETEFAEVRFDGDKRQAAKVYADFQPLTSSDVAETVVFMLNRPEHVNILDVVIQGKQQASSTVIERSGR